MSGYALKVALRGAKPTVWRRLAVPSGLTLAELHHVLQIAMGWTNSHLHQFEQSGEYFGPPDAELDVDLQRTDERRVRLSDRLRTPGDRLVYEYDFGDGWEHDVVLEAIEDVPPSAPVVRDARGACPPEDVGGVGGYAEFLKAIGNPRHPDHASMREWTGGEFDPAAFDAVGVNRMLSLVRVGRAGTVRRKRTPAERRKVAEK